MNKRSYLPLLIIILLLFGGAAFWFLNYSNFDSGLSTPSRDEVAATDDQERERVNKPETEQTKKPSTGPVKPSPEPDRPVEREPKPESPFEIEKRPEQEPKAVREAVEATEAQEVEALSKEGEAQPATVVFTRKNFPDRWYGLALDIQGDPEEHTASDWKNSEAMLRRQATCPWPNAEGFLFGRLRCDVPRPEGSIAPEVEQEDPKPKKKKPSKKKKRKVDRSDPPVPEELLPSRQPSYDWKELGAVVTLDPESKENVGVVSSAGSFFLSLNAKQKKKLNSSVGLKAYVHCAGFVPEGHNRALKSITLKGGNAKLHSIDMVPSNKLILEINMPDGFKESGKIWVEQSPDLDGVGWDDAIYISTDIMPGEPVYISLPSRVGEIRIGGWGDEWHTVGVIKKRFQTLQYTKIKLKIKHSFMQRHSGTVIEQVIEKLDKEDEDVRGTTYARLSQESSGIVTYTRKNGSFDIDEDVTSASGTIEISYRTGIRANFNTRSKEYAGIAGDLRIWFPFWIHDVEIEFRTEISHSYNVIIHNYPASIPILSVEKNGRTVRVKWFPRMESMMSVDNGSKKTGKRRLLKWKVGRGDLYGTKPIKIKVYDKH